ncbi:MAG TPA: flagella basal body P-ring formation protein FlgA, partial [Firmicutes bacterium]|nr:flagella basal body P-ring formation protein FlgA [Bacillota bacterium]
MNKLYKVGLLVALIILLQIPVSGEAPEVTFEIPETVAVNGPNVCFNDLGAIKEDTPVRTGYFLKQIDLGPAPAPGQVRILGREYLNSIIQQYKMPFSIHLEMADQVTVKSNAICIQKAELEQAIQNLFSEKKPHLLKKWVEVQNMPDSLWVSQGKWEIEASLVGNPGEVGNGLFKVALTKGSENRILNICGKIRARALVYRAIRDIPRQASLDPTDFELIEAELQNSRELISEFPAKIRATKLIKQGEIIRSEWFQPIPLVCKDQEVTVIARDENVGVKMVGLAKMDGWRGDMIPIINPVSHKTIKAKVT